MKFYKTVKGCWFGNGCSGRKSRKSVKTRLIRKAKMDFRRNDIFNL